MSAPAIVTYIVLGGLAGMYALTVGVSCIVEVSERRQRICGLGMVAGLWPLYAWFIRGHVTEAMAEAAEFPMSLVWLAVLVALMVSGTLSCVAVLARFKMLGDAFRMLLVDGSLLATPSLVSVALMRLAFT